MKLWQLVVFGLVGLADLFMIAKGMPRVITKPLIMISLMVFSFLTIGSIRKDNIILYLAMLFAFMGDVFLMKEGSTFFMMGLASFLVMQLLYSYIFYKQKMIGVHKRKWPVLILLILFLLFLFLFVPQTGRLKIPVGIYTLSIVLMAVLAILRWKITGYWWVVFGALFFIVSDGVLGVNRFAKPIQFGGLIVMATYCIAQGSIIHGLLLAHQQQEDHTTD